jgi:phage-related protein (TIGR01555 family)
MSKNMELDGWGDILGGLGTENSDRNVYFKKASKLQPEDLQNILVYDGLANIVCSEIPGDGLRNGINIQGDKNDFIKDKMSKLNYKNTFIDAWTSARGLGGSIVVLDIDDGQEIDEPVKETNIDDIKDMVLYDRTSVQILTENFETDVESDNFGKLKYYSVTYQNGSPHKIHVSRCLYFGGEYLPTELKEQNDFFDGSVIQRVYNSLTKIAPAFEYTNKLLKRFNILKFGIKGLSEIVAAGRKQEVKDRLQIMKQSMDIMSACMYDADGEQITSETISLNGIPELLKMMMIL